MIIANDDGCDDDDSNDSIDGDGKKKKQMGGIIAFFLTALNKCHLRICWPTKKDQELANTPYIQCGLIKHTVFSKVKHLDGKMAYKCLPFQWL